MTDRHSEDIIPLRTCTHRERFADEAAVAITPRIYITFIPAVQSGGRPAQKKVTLGPYLNVELSDGGMQVTATLTDPENDEPVCLATATGSGWTLHDDSEVGGGQFAWVMVSTIPPRPSDSR